MRARSLNVTYTSMSSASVRSVLFSGAILLGIGLSGCGYITGEKPIPTTSAELGVRPAIAGAGVGGVIGGALGAIVGSTTGDAGAGLAIGSVAGASAGGLIGYTVEQSKGELAEQKERVARQQELLDTQRRTLEELRNSPRIDGNKGSNLSQRGRLGQHGLAAGSGLTAASIPLGSDIGKGATGRSSSSRALRAGQPINDFNRSSTLLRNGAAFANYRGSPRAKSYTETNEERDWRKSVQLDSRVESGSRADRVEAKSTLAAVDSDMERSDASKALAGGLPAAKTDSPLADLAAEAEGSKLDEVTESGGAEIRAEVEDVSPMQQDSGSTQKKTTSVVATTASAADTAKQAVVGAGKLPVAATQAAASDSCEQGKVEYDHAKRAVSDADRLFYLRRAIKMCPSDVGYHIEIGQVYASIGREEDAKFEYRQVLDLDPENVDAREQLGLLEKSAAQQVVE